MATIKKSVIIGQPATLTGSKKQTVITTLTAKKPLKLDTVVKKAPVAATKTTYPSLKTSTKPIISKMAPVKVSTTSVDKSAASPKSAAPKSNAAVTSSLKPVITKTPVKRVVADSTSSDTAAKPPVKKLSTSAGVARSTAKITTKPVTSSDSKLKTTSNVETKTATAGAKIKAAISTSKSLAKPSVEAKLPAKAKLSSPTSLVKAKPINSILVSKANLVTSTKPTTSTLVTRTPAPKVDIKKSAAVARKTPATTKTTSKLVSVVKPSSISTPLTTKNIKKCAEVEICDADSTSLTMNDQMEMDTDFGSVAPSKETESLEFNEMQAYKVAEQMMEVLGTAVVTNETQEQDRLLEESVVIDMAALRVDNQTSVQMAEELASVPEEVQCEKMISADCEPAENTGNHLSKDVESCPDLITFGDSAAICEEMQGVSVEGAETTAEDGITEEASVECTDDRDEEIEVSVETENALTDEEVSADDSLAVTDKMYEPLEGIISDEKSTESIIEDCCEELDESAADEKMTSEVENLENQDENDIQDDDMVQESSANSQLHSHFAEPENGVTYDETEVTCNDETVDAEMENNQCEITSENKVEGQIVHDYDSCSTKAEVSDENMEVEEQNEITDERPFIIDAEIHSENVANAADDNSQPEQSEETFEEVADTCTNIKIQEDHFGETPVPKCVNSDDHCNGDDFVVIRLDDENGDEELEQCALIADDCSAMEKCADTESVGSLDSVASYADVVKQSTVECATNFETIESVEPLDDSEVCEDEEISQETMADANELPGVAKVDEEEVADAEVADAEVADDDAAKGAEIVDGEAAEDTEAGESAEAVSEAEDVDTDPAEMQAVKVESLLGSITDEVQIELDAGMEHSHAVDEEGYEKVQKKRNKRQNKRNRKSLKALKKENIEGEPLIEGQESQRDNSQVFQKRKNFRKSKNSMKKQYRRYSEPYTVSECYTTPVWRSFYAEN